MSESAGLAGHHWISAAPRSALSLRALLPVCLWIWALDGLDRCVPEGLRVWALAAAVALTGPLPWAVCAYQAAARAAGRKAGLRESLSRTRRSLAAIYGAPLFTVAVPAFFLSIAWAGGLVGRIPLVGGFFLTSWALTGGLLLSVLAACWIVVGLPAISLQIPASVIQHPHAMDIASRSLSYVRRRPLLIVSSWLLGAGTTLLGGAAFLVLLSIVLGSLAAVLDVGAGVRPEISVLAAQVTALWRQPATWWPLSAPWACRVPTSVVGGWEILLSRFAPAFLLASLACSSARIYASARWAVDGTPLHDLDA